MKKPITERNCFKTEEWYQDECKNLKKLKIDIAKTKCPPFDASIDSLWSLRYLSDDELKKKAISFDLTSFEMLDREYTIQTVFILSLRKRALDYLDSQEKYFERIRDCAAAREEHYEYCKDCPNWYEDKGHKFARISLSESSRRCGELINETKDYLEMMNDRYDKFLKSHQQTQTSSLNDNNTKQAFVIKEVVFRDDTKDEKKEAIEARHEKEVEKRNIQRKKAMKDPKKLEQIEMMKKGDEYFHNVRKGILKLYRDTDREKTMTSFPWIENFISLLKSFKLFDERNAGITEQTKIDQYKKMCSLYREKIAAFDPPLNLLPYGSFKSSCYRELFSVLIEHGTKDNIWMWESFFEPFIYYQKENVDGIDTIVRDKNCYGKTGYGYLASSAGSHYFMLFLYVYVEKVFETKNVECNQFVFNVMLSLLDFKIYDEFLKDVVHDFKYDEMSKAEVKLFLQVVASTSEFLMWKICAADSVFYNWKDNFGPHKQLCKDIFDTCGRLYNMIASSKNKIFTFEFKGHTLKIHIPTQKILQKENTLKEMAKWYDENCKKKSIDDIVAFVENTKSSQRKH